MLTLLAGSLEVILAAVNCRYFGRYGMRTRVPSRRAGAWALALVSGAMALEGASFLLRGSGLAVGQTLRLLGDLAVRCGLLAAAGAVSLLIWRGRRFLR